MQMNTRTSILAILLNVSLIVLLLPLPVSGLAPDLPDKRADTRAATSQVLAQVRDASPLSQASATEPDVLSQPISVSRAQSSYVAGTTIITLTVTNNLPPTFVPDVPAGATVTDTIDILATFVLTDDANTLRGLAVEDTLTPGTTLLAATGSPTQTGSTLTWRLPDLPPQASATITMSVGTPAAGGDFVELDGGASVSASRWGDPVGALARPAVLIPGGIEPAFTAPTPDADSFDADMLWVAAGFAQDPVAAFEYVRSLAYEPYEGSLRGTRGTLWGAAGNSADQSSLLVAMLRGAGVPARYRHGTLNTADAQTLLAGMFPASQGQAGYLPAGTELADPVNDPALIALTADHWWVEAYLPGSGWTDLDPSFPGAAVGQSFATPDANDRIAELPDNQRHTLTVRLKVEQYNAFPVGGVNLTTLYPLEATFATAQLASKRLTFNHLVVSEVQGGIYTNVTHTFTPFFSIQENGLAVQGDPFQDLLTNFPLASHFTTAEWLEYEISDPDGNAETFVRSVKDLIGADVRLQGGTPQLDAGLDSPPFALREDLYVNWVLPNDVPDWVYERQRMNLLPNLVELGRYGDLLVDIAASTPPGENLSPEDNAIYQQANTKALLANEFLLTGIGLDFAWAADRAVAQIETGLRTKLYYAAPRVFTVSSVGDPAGVMTPTVDLRRTTTRDVVYPGQARAAALTAQWVKGLVESDLEGQALEDFYGVPAITTARLFDEMEAQGIDSVLITPAEAYLLDVYPFSAQAQALVATALGEGKSVLIPTAPVRIDGQDLFGWWEIDPQTGETVSLMDNGLHSSAIPYKLFEELLIFGVGQLSSTDPGIVIQFATQIGEGLREKFERLLREWEQAMGRALSAPLASPAATWRYQPAHLCPVDNCGVEQFFLADLPAGPIPLPEMIFAYDPATDAGAVGRATVPVAADQPPGTPAFSLAASPPTSSTPPDAPVNFQADVSSNFDDDFVIMAYAPDGWDVVLDETGAVTALPAVGVAPGTYLIQLVAQSSLYPELVATAQHAVTVNAQEAVSLALNPEPNVTVPMGQAQVAAVSNQTNDGEAEIGGAAYVVELTNRSTTDHTFDLSVGGPPAGWVVLDGLRQAATSVALPAGATARVGLYVAPPPDTLPAPGTSHPVNVTATAADNPSLTASDGATFAMSSQPFNYLTLSPDTLYLTADSSADLTISMENVGNAAGTFPLEATTPLSAASFSGVPASFSLAVGESQSAVATLNVTDAPLGARFPILLASPAPGSYTQYALADVQIVSESSGPVFRTGEKVDAECTLGEPGLSAALETLALAMVQLEASCEYGDCNLGLRDQAVAALRSAAGYAGGISPLATADETLDALADTLAGHTADADILADLAAIGAALADVEAEVCALSQHLPELRWTPGYGAALAGEPATYTLDLTNLGTLTTTYALTVELPSDQQTFETTVAPGATDSTDFSLNVGALGLYELTAVAVGQIGNLPPIGDEATAALNVVDRYVQLTAVHLDPAFVETGVSSTTVRIDVSNVANVARPATARLTFLAPGGGVAYTADQPLTILAGTPRTYELDTVDTSGWAAGTYTATVELLDDDLSLIPDGSGYALLGVGQALGASHSIAPLVVAPGTVTVTTILSTEILAESILPTASPSRALWPPTGLRSPFTTPVSVDAGQSPVTEVQTTTTTTTTSPLAEAPEGEPLPPSPATITGTVIVRHEEDEAALTGTWTSHNNGRASNGGFLRADTAGETATFTVTGTWIHLGFLVGTLSGHAEVYIDGVSQGVLDLYRHDTTPVSFVYDGLVSATHTISVTALGTANPYANNDYVNIDYVDVYDGGTYADGTFEEDDTRLFLSTGWDLFNDGAASGGSYMREDNATAWFPFTGDSVTYQALAYNGGGRVDVSIDGVFQTRLNLHSLAALTRTLSFEGLGAGPHVLQVTGYRGNTTVDAFLTPGQPPFWTPPTASGFTRFEDDDPAMLYNGVPFTRTAQSWTRSNHVYYSEASDGQRIYSRTAGDTVSLTFDGVWASVGFFTNKNSGQAEIYLDGASQGIVDLYSNEEDVTSFTYDGLVAGSHTLSVTVLGTANPLAQNTYVSFDYVDAWDGSPLPDGHFEEMDERVLLGGGWSHVADADASGGAYLETGLHGEPTFWFPFTGDSVTYQALDYWRSNEVAIYIDEVYQGLYDIDTGQAPTITYSFDNLGAGLHLLKVRHYRDEATLDAFITPAISPPAPPPTPTLFTRTEEDDPAIRYNGLPYTTTAATWNRYDGVTEASDGQYIRSAAPGDWVSFDFDGTWIGVGFATDRYSGQAEVFIDGASQGVVDLYSSDDDVASFVYDGLADTTHTISATLLSTANPYASGTRLHVDYFDTWSGDPLPAGTYEESHPLVYRGDIYDSWNVSADADASGGSYMSDGFQRTSTVWFPFTGDSVTFLGLAKGDADEVRISIDGVAQDVFNLYSGTPLTRAFSFDGLGGGPHVMEVRHYKDEPNVDAFVVPGIPPFYETPVYTGVVRYEEDDPALVYNGDADFRVRPQSWVVRKTWTTVSGGWYVYSGVASDTISLTFDGRWAGIGFIGRNGTSQAEVFIDGVSQGVLDLDNGGAGELFHTFGGLVTGTHTLSVSVVSGYVSFDYVNVWDGQPTPDETTNIRRGEDDSRLSYSTNINDYGHPNAIEGDYAGVPIFNFPGNLWYNFVGDSFTFYYLSERNGGSVNVYVDGQFVETVSQDYEFSEQPFGVSYDGFGDGPHVVRVESVSAIRADAFRTPADPLPYMPLVEWYDTTPNGGTGAFGTPAGAITGMAAGDVDGDGATEIVLPADTYAPDTAEFVNSIFIFRGDGADTGDGDPIIERIDIGTPGGVERELIGSVALADLDGQPGAEIVVAGRQNMYAFHSDGTTYWMTDTLPAESIRGTPAIGNLDLDPEPEIVVNLRETLAVFEHDGAIAWTDTLPDTVGMPLLVDMDENGTLDIVAYDVAGNVYLYDYNYGTPTLEWTTTLSSSVDFIFGGPAFADVDGQQPGGDDGPEIAITSNGRHTVLDADGSVVWSTVLDPGDGGGVSVADVDGDGEIELVTGTRYDDGTGVGRLYALNADGSILWGVPAYDSTSANSQSVLDLNGDGVYEIAWNGAQHGFVIYNGTDGSILYNEPLIESLTGTEYPIFADVDDDGYAEVAVPYNDGLAVVGMDGVWGEARPLWNQHTYHITNVNDDLTVPFSEAPSWDVHNTFRTQTTLRDPLPVYDVALTHTVGISGVAVLTDTFNVAPDLSADPTYGWGYAQTGAEPVVTRTFDVQLAGLQPGESRLVAQGTDVAYTLPSGQNRLHLPPLYVSVPHIAALAPASQTVGAGATAAYTLTLSNPADSPSTYTLSLSGLPGGWATLPADVLVPAGGEATAQLLVAVPAAASPEAFAFSVGVETDLGGSSQANGALAVVDALDVAVTPPAQAAPTGQAVSYTLTVTNYEAVARTYTLSSTGLATLSLPPSINVGANGTASLEFAAQAIGPGPNPFTVVATAASGASDADTALLTGEGSQQVAVQLDPAVASGGPGEPTLFTVTVRNLGSAGETYDLSVDAPAGWASELTLLGNPVSAVTLLPGAANAVELQLLVTPPATASAGDYPLAVQADSQTLRLGRAGVRQASASGSATVQIGALGVEVEILSGDTSLLPGGSGAWQVQVTNTGSQADTYDLSAFGPLAAFATVNPATVGLGAGQSQTVQVTAGDLTTFLPGGTFLGVDARSQTEGAIHDEDTYAVEIVAVEGVEVALQPAARTVSGTLEATFTLVVTNTGNENVIFQLATGVSPAGVAALGAKSLPISPRTAVRLPVTIRVQGGGTYQVEASASSSGVQASDTASLTVIHDAPGPQFRLFLPVVVRNTTGEGAPPQYRIFLPHVSNGNSTSFVR